MKRSGPDTTATSLTRRSLTMGLAAASLCASLPASAATDWPNRTVTVIVPFPAGGNTDTMARLLAEYMGRKFGQTFIIDNRPAAGGTLATGQLAKTKPDGYNLMFGSAAQLIILPMLQKVTYDSAKDLAPLSIFGTGPFILGVKQSLPVDSLKDLIAYAKANPGKLNVASAGTGSIGHLSAALFAKRAGIDIVPIPYKGGGPAIAALVAGEVDMYFGNASELLQFSTGGRLKLLAVSSLTSIPQLPDVPPVASLYPGFKTSSWNGLIGPLGMAPELSEKIIAATVEASKDPTIVQRLQTLGIEPTGSTAAEFLSILNAERVLYREGVDAAGLKMEL
ncbi:MAG: transporter substrate-binding protein [Hyphomicrobiales bacterium]|nr:transporter substrate-binding protein [Hyphomicrobiales bacterium]